MSRTKIESLTPEQIARFPEYVQRWTDIGLCTAPASREAAEEAIREMYRAAGKEPPKKIVWCGSPLSQGLTRAIILDKKLVSDIGKSVRASVWDSVRASVGASVRASVWASVGDSVYGQHDASWLAFYKYFHDECNLVGETQKLEGLWLLAKSAGWALPHENICWISERHNILERDDRGRLHNLTGPACAYPDGWAIYAVHGTRVPADIIEDRSTLTVSRIEAETNAEVRRVMIDLYDPKRYLADSGARIIQELPANHYIVGLRTARLLQKDVADDEPIVMVDLLNSTPEPDGSTKRYLLRVDPNAYEGLASRDCLAAAASTWRLPDGALAFKRPQDYAPVFES